jgi:glycogen operon protein
VAVLLNGQTLQVTDEDGDKVIDDSFFLIVNAAEDGVEYVLPASPSGRRWCQVIDTENIENPFTRTEVNGKIIAGGRALKLFSDGSVS